MGRRTPGRETLQENIPFLNEFLRKHVIFGLQTSFFDGFNVLMSFLTQKWYRTVMKSPKKASFGPEMYEIWPKVVIWGIRRTGFPPEDSPLFYRASSGCNDLRGFQGRHLPPSPQSNTKIQQIKTKNKSTNNKVLSAPINLFVGLAW